MTVFVKAPGSCGELVQGTIEGVSFLVTCPIDLFSTVRIKSGLPGPGPYVKAQTAVYKTMEYLACYADIQVDINTQLLSGKGMASSSADISAACQATAQYFGKRLSPQEIATLALDIEPTDGIFFPGVVMFDHINGTLCRYLGNPPPIKIAVFDCGGEVDTIYFNKRRDLAVLNQEKETIVKQALQLVTAGITAGDCRLIGEGATISAIANQTILPKPCLQQVIDLAERGGAIGVTIAHSGTVIGVLFDPLRMDRHHSCIQKIMDDANIKYLTTVQMVTGGLRIEEGDDSE